MLYVAGDKLLVQPSYTPLGVGSVVVATKDNGFDTVHALTVRWLAQSCSDNVSVNGVWWYLVDKENSKDGKYHLSYSSSTDTTVKVELFSHEKLAGVITWINQQFKQLLPDLLDNRYDGDHP